MSNHATHCKILRPYPIKYLSYSKLDICRLAAKSRKNVLNDTVSRNKFKVQSSRVKVHSSWVGRDQIRKRLSTSVFLAMFQRPMPWRTPRTNTYTVTRKNNNAVYTHIFYQIWCISYNKPRAGSGVVRILTRSVSWRIWYCCLLGPLLCIVSFHCYVCCLLVVLVKLSVLGQLSHLPYSSWC